MQSTIIFVEIRLMNVTKVQSTVINTFTTNLQILRDSVACDSRVVVGYKYYATLSLAIHVLLLATNITRLCRLRFTCCCWLQILRDSVACDLCGVFCYKYYAALPLGFVRYFNATNILRLCRVSTFAPAPRHSSASVAACRVRLRACEFGFDYSVFLRNMVLLLFQIPQ